MNRRNQRRWPRPGLLLLLAPSLLAIILWLGCTVLARVADPAAGGMVYTVAQVQAHLAPDQGAWVGRTVLVKGRVESFVTWRPPHSIVMRIDLIDPVAPSGAAGLALAWGNADPLLMFLRRLPVLGQFAPRPQAPDWDRPATYRVRLRALPSSSCMLLPCYEALLVDAALDSPAGG